MQKINGFDGQRRGLKVEIFPAGSYAVREREKELLNPTSLILVDRLKG